MIVTFSYSTPTGILTIPCQVDERRPFNRIIEEAHEIARAIAAGPVTFLTAALPHQRRGGLRHVSESVDALLVRARRFSSVEGPLRATKQESV